MGAIRISCTGPTGLPPAESVWSTSTSRHPEGNQHKRSRSYIPGATQRAKPIHWSISRSILPSLINKTLICFKVPHLEQQLASNPKGEEYHDLRVLILIPIQKWYSPLPSRTFCLHDHRGCSPSAFPVLLC